MDQRAPMSGPTQTTLTVGMLEAGYEALRERLPIDLKAATWPDRGGGPHEHG